MSCSPKLTKKYMGRPSPPIPANKCPAGERQMGNDGTMYVATPDYRGVNTWKPVEKKSKSPKRKTTGSKSPKQRKRNGSKSPKRKTTGSKSPTKQRKRNGSKSPKRSAGRRSKH